MIRLEFSPEAEQDLESVGDYIAKDNPRRAASFVRELKAQCCKITNAPKGYRERPELGQGIRFCAYGNYVVFFTKSPVLYELCVFYMLQWTSSPSFLTPN